MIFLLIYVDEEDLVDTESLAYKAQQRPGAIELLNKRFDELHDQFKSTKTELNQTKQELAILKKRHLVFSFNFRVINVIQTVLNLEKKLINRYIPIPITVNVLRRKHSPLVVALQDIQNSNEFKRLKKSRYRAAHEPITNILDFEESLQFLKEQQPSVLSEEESVYFNWMELNFPIIKHIILEINKIN